MLRQRGRLYVTGRDVEYMELSLQFENCIWECKSCENAEDVRQREIPEFIFRVVRFMAEHCEWCGNATDLLAEMEDTTTSINTVTKLLNQYHWVLAEKSFEYQYYRTGKSRLIKLKSDGYDTCDSSVSPGEQPSQPSPTVTFGGSSLAEHTDFACKV